MHKKPYLISSASLIAAATLLASAPALPASQTASQAPSQISVSLNTVQVQSSRPGVSRRQSPLAKRASVPGAVDVINGNKLQQRPVNNMADALRYVPGVTAISETGSGELFLSIRGSNLDAIDYDNNGVRLFQDGLPVTTADGSNHNRMLNAATARSITVANGANALRYGASTLGGAINAVTRTALNSDPNTLFIGGGSHGQAIGRLSVGGVAGDVDGMLTLSRTLWDGYRDHSKQTVNSVYANLGWQASDTWRWLFYLSHRDSVQELTGALTRAQVEADRDQSGGMSEPGDFHKNVVSDRVAVKATQQLSANSQLAFGVSYEQQQLFHPIVYAPPYFSLLIDTDKHTTGGMVRYNLNLGDHKLLAGLNVAYTAVDGGNYQNDGGQRGKISNDVSNDASSVTLYLMDEWQFASRWTLNYGVQGVIARRNTRSIDNYAGGFGSNSHFNGHYDAINPRVGLIYTLSDSAEAYASVSRLFEAPTTYQLKDPMQPGNTLGAMHGIVYETGVRGQSNASRWSLSVYYAQIQDEILSIEKPGAPGTYLSGNADDTVHAGIEAKWGMRFDLGEEQSINPLISATYNQFQFKNSTSYGDNDLPGAPQYAVHGELMYRNDFGFYAGPTFDFVGSRYADFTNSYKVDGYELVGLRVGVDKGRWEVFVEGRNLTDEDYIVSTSVKADAATNAAVLYPSAPVSVYAGLRIHY